MTFPCNDCGTPVELFGIDPKEADGTIHNSRRCMGIVKGQRDEARAEAARLTPKPFSHYPPGMGEESRRLHREYNALVAAQLAGAKNGADVVRLTDECSEKGIILVPGGEHL